MATFGRHIEIRGIVQGVGFRPWVYRLATEEGLAGHVRNDATGVTIEAFGSLEALDAFTRRLETSLPPAARIREVRARVIPAESIASFSIVQSEERLERRVSIPPDLPTCPDCLSEIFDRANRRFRYPFTNCTNCGPRFTIARDVPYDRASTTMSTFRMCPDCRREYEDVSNRRFHAQPNACPVCGPRLTLLTADGARVECEDPIALAAAALESGEIVAIKGLGGFHFACDATSSEAVQRLRARKRRDEKPFAVMVADLARADAFAALTVEEQRLLTSVERPIVLATRRDDCALAPEVAPRNPLVGLLLPYTPLHHLLVHDAGLPLVMTSGNLSEEPLAYRNDEALQRLAGVADLFLVHDREIETRCDDSVARVIASRSVVIRRARGYVPRAIQVSPPFAAPVLACGGLLKNTFCIGIGGCAYLGPHIGDLGNLETLGSFEESVARMERFLRVVPEIVAYDLHPEYLSTEYALRRAEPLKIGAQHHHAHVVSAMAEHGLSGPVIGVAYDGTGYGTDGTAWGGEVMVATRDDFERVATLRPIPLAGADAAIHQPWRIALALVEDAFEGQGPIEVLPLFTAIKPHDRAVVQQMLDARFRSPLAHGAGRYFDGIGALVLERPESRYEGQIALEWNVIADPNDDEQYGFDVDTRVSPWSIDLRPMVRAVVGDVLARVPAPAISARFHNTMVSATAAVVRLAARSRGALPVVLTGGCFQNARLSERLARALSPQLQVYLHGEVPPGDGGLSLGQAVAAAAVARRLAREKQACV
ncbi:MAG TPA: carbamoyltransferase HypF [Vicinamibacterales bacterium]|nr:carbamoyltransferase HypF [Vicinamibacterales bacterium]